MSFDVLNVSRGRGCWSAIYDFVLKNPRIFGRLPYIEMPLFGREGFLCLVSGEIGAIAPNSAFVLFLLY